MVTARIRRLTPNVKKTLDPKVVKALKAHLKLIAKAEADMSASRRLAAEAEIYMLDTMRKHKIESVTGDDGEVATITQTAGKGSNYIDPLALRKKVKDDKDFYSAITVSISKAKDILSGKEFEALAKFTPGTPGEPKLKVSYPKD